jgi:asparagine synthase (glutamine-hydrolysing)
MCGILGAFQSEGRLPDAGLFAQCLNSLRRRGPDDSGVWSEGPVRLGHRRLAVVDISTAGHQPMVSADGRYVITFNGEIYNHAELRQRLTPGGGAWRSRSDTETLLEAFRTWGVECLQQLQGMFAFAIWDKVERRLFVARDRLGVKPLYFSWRNGSFVFGSRPGSVAALCGSGAGDFDPQALRVYLELGYIPAPLSFHRHIQKLRAAHYLLIDANGPRAFRYWDYRHIAPDAALLRRNDNELVDELEELLGRSVRARLMSDVPLGAFLSGGADSAMIVAAMKKAGAAGLQAFTIAFAEKEYDEGPAAARIAKHLQVNHVTETLHVSDLLALLPDYIEQFDEPFADSSSFPTMAVARLARRHVTVALSGDGGDELFGGYHYYDLLRRLCRLDGIPAHARSLLTRGLQPLPSHGAKLLAGALRRPSPAARFNFLRGCGKDFGTLVTPAVEQTTTPSGSLFEQLAAGFAMDLPQAEVGMRLDLGFTLTDGYLQKVDVATMAFSLEARCPMVDYRLVEWAMRLPLHFKIREGETKYLLKKALCRHLPPELVYRPKWGFGVPVACWLRGPLRSWAEDLLHDSGVMSRLPLDGARIRKLFELHASGRRDAHPVLWATLMLLCYVARHDRGLQLPKLPVARAA